TPPLQLGSADEGKSFPCGHCSVGFALASLWLVLRRWRPVLSWAALGVAVALGASMGYARIAAGGHYLSDVLWAAWISLFAAWLSYYVILRIPAREAGLIGPARRWPRPVLWTAYGLGGVGVILGALLATPVELRWEHAFDMPAGEFVLVIDHARPELVLAASDHGRMEVKADWQGFGLPGARLLVEQSMQGLRLHPQGLFTELRDQVRVRAMLSDKESLRLELREKPGLRVRCEGVFERLPLTVNLPPERIQLENCPKPSSGL
ncbi:MAG: phosphatase PAP2 family protein, partial [Halothiobacillaceae bacterium]